MPLWRRAAKVIERPDMHRNRTCTTPQPIVPNTDIALIVYILYFVGYFTGITAIVGVIMAHVQVDTADPMLAHALPLSDSGPSGLAYCTSLLGRSCRCIVIGVGRARLVVHLVAGTLHQGCAGAERAPADCESGLMVVRVMSAAPGWRAHSRRGLRSLLARYRREVVRIRLPTSCSSAAAPPALSCSTARRRSMR